MMTKTTNAMRIFIRRPVTGRSADLRVLQACLLLGHVLTIAAGLRALTTLTLTEPELFLGAFLLIGLNVPLVAAGAALELLIRVSRRPVE